MQAGFSSFNTNYSNFTSNVSFSGRVDKIIEALKNIKDYKHAKVTLNEAMAVYKKLGYQLRAKAGSHVTVTAPNGFEFCLKLPHGCERQFINQYDVKKLQCAANGDMEGLIRAIRF